MLPLVIARLFLSALFCCLTVLPAQAQPLPPLQLVRPLPADAVLGRLTPQPYPQAILDGTLRRLTPASRVFDAKNRLVMPASLSMMAQAGTPVAYRLDMQGQVREIWILNPEEFERLAALRR
jgi:hypothetical protein